MAKILAISSQVASGHVGLSAAMPALHAFGHEVIALPTIILANHPGRQPTSGTRIEPDVLTRMLDTLHTNSRLDGLAGVITGYLPSAAHVAVAKHAVTLCRAASPNLTYLCDPIIGDDPKGVYIDEAAAKAIRDTLLPRADIITPNRFELEWLTGRTIADVDDAIAASKALNRPTVVAKSIPGDGRDMIANIAVTPDMTEILSIKKCDGVPNGTGDLFAALLLSAHVRNPDDIFQALTMAVGLTQDVISESIGKPELAIPQTLRRILTRAAAKRI